MSRRCKRSADVSMALRGWQRGLRRGRTNAAQRVDDRRADPPRQIGGLIEASLASPRTMERHRHDHIGAVDYFSPTRAQEAAQRLRERAAAVVLDRVDDR